MIEDEEDPIARERMAQAEEAFAAWATRRESGQGEDFVELLEQNRACANELRTLHEEQQLFEPVLEKLVPGQFSAGGALRLGRLREVEESEEQLSGRLHELLDVRTSLTSRYRFRKVLGQGGGGVVLCVLDTKLDRLLAMKLAMKHGQALRADRKSMIEPVPLARFVNEARITSQLEHPGIVPIHDLGTDDMGRPFYTMKLVAGEDLGKVIEHVHAGRGTWTRTRALQVLLRVCEALAAAHDKGVVHRDLKPANIMVGEYGEVHVMDWGFAKVLGVDGPERAETTPADGHGSESAGGDTEHEHVPLGHTVEGQVVGTPSYMPPEQALGHLDRIDMRSDVYAVGAILYELLAGHAPYMDSRSASSQEALIQAVVDGPPTSLDSIDANVDPELSAICERAMAREKENRYPSARELSDDISRYLDGRVVSARQVGPVVRTRKWLRRNKSLATSLALLAIALVAGTTLSTANAVRAESARAEAAQKTEDVLALSDLRAIDDLHQAAAALWPPVPSNVARYEAWLSDARGLLVGRTPRETSQAAATPSLEDRKLLLARLRERHDANSNSSETSDGKRREIQARLDHERKSQAWSSRMLRREPWPRTRESELEAARRCAGLNPQELLVLARSGVGRNMGGRDFSDPTITLLIAEAAVSAASSVDAASTRLTCAEALYICADFTQAREMAASALRCATPDQLESVQVSARKINVFIDRWSIPLHRQYIELDYERRAAKVADLEKELARSVHYEFSDRRTQWLHDTHSELIHDLEDLDDPRKGLIAGDHADFGWGIEHRLRFARTVAELTVEGPEARDAWNAAMDWARRSPVYAGVDLRPRVGLLPLGPDPQSGLLEFAVLASGEPPQRGSDGRFQMDQESAIVLVLLPGGAFEMGAETRKSEPGYDPNADTDEAPRNRVELVPFLLSKYEVTQAQWWRLTFTNPSTFPADSVWFGGVVTLAHPVDSVSHAEASRVLSRFGMVLPSEAQWEYAGRTGGRDTQPSANEAPASRPLFNYADKNLKLIALRGSNSIAGNEADDGFGLHAPVGSFLPNAFGLHDMQGNVAEWCADEYGSYWFKTRAGDGRRDVAFSTTIVVRGGSFFDPASWCRSTSRRNRNTNDKSGSVGIRPAMTMTVPDKQ